MSTREETLATARAGIEAMRDYFRSIGMPVNLTELIGRRPTEEEIDHMAAMATKNGTATLGSLRKLGLEDVKHIYNAAV